MTVVYNIDNFSVIYNALVYRARRIFHIVRVYVCG